MNNKRSFITILVLLLVIAVIMIIKSNQRQYVILVSMDAFRWDYSQIYDTPNLDRIARKGVKAGSLIPAYPSKTFPNHYSIATGLYPDHHGIISNTFYAPDLGLLYRIGDRAMVENGDFYGGEPIWTTVEKNGLIAASMFWVGSEAPVNGHQPTYWSIYDENISYSARLDSVINWLSLPKKKRPGFITLYFDEPDGTSHDYGPVSGETDSIVQYMDGIIGDLYGRLMELPAGKKINLLVVSDHGMGEVSGDRTINLLDIIPEGMVEYYTGGSPVVFIDPVDEFRDSLLAILENSPHIKVWTGETLPGHYHFGTHSRIPEIIIEADSSWSIIRSDREDYYMSSKGTHGYDPRNTDMHGIFYALGPAFRKDYESGSFYNIDIYNLICNILKIKPAKNDGNQERIESLLK